MRLKRPEMWLLVAIAAWLAASTAWADEAGDRAAQAIERHRDAKHRAEVRIIWPEPAAWDPPPDLDVLLITGLDVLRFHRAHGGPVVCERVGRPPRSPHHDRGDDLEARRVEIDPRRFDVGWNAAYRLLQAGAELVNPPPDPTVIIVDGDGEIVEMIDRMPKTSITASSHAVDEWLRIREGDGAPIAAACLSGFLAHDDILDFDQLRTRGLRQVFLDLPGDAIDAGEPFPLGEWVPWLEAELARLPPDDGKADLDRFTNVLCTAVLRLLGETDEERARETIEAFRVRLAACEPAGPWASSLREEADRAVERIGFRRHWDSAAATRLIHGGAGGGSFNRGQESWLRRMFRERDPAGYAALLRSDLRSPDERLMRASITELAVLRPEGWIEDLRRLLDSDDDEVACDAAFALLGVSRHDGHAAAERTAAIAAAAEATAHDERLAAAWRAIEGLAGDPGVPIPPGLWSGARGDAVRLLVSPACPQPWHWDRQRVIRQLENPAETDARMIATLLEAIGVQVSRKPGSPPALQDRDFLVRAWRRGLGKPYTYGTVQAIEHLVDCGDAESMPEIRRIIDDLEDGCDRITSPRPATPARYWWITIGQVRNLRARVDSMP